MALLFTASAQAGCAPCLDLQINATPVDYVASVIVSLLTTPMGLGQTYHLANQDAVRFVDVARMGKLEVVEPAYWQEAVAKKAPALGRFAPLVCMADAAEMSGSAEPRLQYNRRYENATLRGVLGERFLSPPPMNEAYVGKLWARLQSTLSS